MGIDARIEDENGECLRELLDPKELVVHLLPKYDDITSNCLRFIDPYGDTIFNSLQVSIFISELVKAIANTSNLQAREHGRLLLEMAAQVAESPHIYLKFYGD